MIQRFLYQIAKAGFEALRADPDLVVDIFEQFELSETEIDAIKALIRDKYPTIKHQYARVDDNPPIIAITLGGESEREKYLGDYAGMLEDDGSDIKSAVWEHSYDCWVLAEHPDHTAYLYEILKAILTAAPFEEYDLFETHLSGAELAPDPRWMPANIFVRKLTFRAQTEFVSVQRQTAFTKAFRIDGIHIDKAGGAGDPGPVKTNVRIGSPDEI